MARLPASDVAPVEDNAYALHLGTVTRVKADGTVYVKAPTLVSGYELGPCLVLNSHPVAGSRVVVSTMNNGEQQVVLGVLNGWKVLDDRITSLEDRVTALGG